MNNNDKVIKYCPLCCRSEESAGKLFSMPGGLNICMDCLQKTMDTINNSGAMFNGFGSMNTMSDLSGNLENIASPMKTETGMPPKTDTVEEILESGDPMKKEDDAPSKKDEETEDKKSQFDNLFSNLGLPNVQFMNFSDLQSMMHPGAKVKEKKKKPKKKTTPILNVEDIPKPHIIKEKLDEYVVGQDHAKKVMAVAVYNHYKRVFAEKAREEELLKAQEELLREEGQNAEAIEEINEDMSSELDKVAASDIWNDDVEIEKSNMLMIGPTGCGKTYLVKTLARLLDVPLAITDATSLTEAGYIGDDIESVVSKLLAEADNDVETAERGIIFIDEIDKIAKKNNAKSRDVSGESVQQGMLKLLEGSDIEVPVGASSKNAMVPMVTINTRNILFICGGAFPDLEDVIKKRLSKKSSIGYGAMLKDEFDKEKSILSQVTPEDLREFGMIPEFIGRLPMIFTLEGLNDEMLVKILREPKNAIIRQYEKLLLMDEVKLSFTEEALLAIARRAQEKETGARALRSLIEELMLDIMYEIPKDDNIGEVIITESYVEGKGGPEIVMRIV